MLKHISSPPIHANGTSSLSNGPSRSLHHHFHHTGYSNGAPQNATLTGISRPDSAGNIMEPRIDSTSHSRYQRPINNLNSSIHSAHSMHSLRLHQQPLNISTLHSSKHSIGENSSSISPSQANNAGARYPSPIYNNQNVGRYPSPSHGASGRYPSPNIETPYERTQAYKPSFPSPNARENKLTNGGLNIPHISGTNLLSDPKVNTRDGSSMRYRHCSRGDDEGVKEMLVSLGLLCLVSLLLALLALIFLLKISPVTASDVRELLRAEQLSLITAEEYVAVYEVTLALCALTLSLNLCCLLVCAIQFLFAVKLVKSRHGGSERTNKYLRKSAISRVCAVAGFFISIPVFLTGIILYTFIQFHSTPAIITSTFIGLGIVFCGCAMVHNVFIWQREKTNAVKVMAKCAQERSNAVDVTDFGALPQHALANSTHLLTTPLNQSHNISLTNPNLLNSSIYHNNNNHAYLSNASHLTSIHSRVATPPTPIGKLTVAVGGANSLGAARLQAHHPREPSGGSASPGTALGSGHAVDRSANSRILDISSADTTNSHELSTLV